MSEYGVSHSVVNVGIYVVSNCRKIELSKIYVEYTIELEDGSVLLYLTVIYEIEYDLGGYYDSVSGVMGYM